jgi:hypothetical protein
MRTNTYIMISEKSIFNLTDKMWPSTLLISYISKIILKPLLHNIVLCAKMRS